VTWVTLQRPAHGWPFLCERPIAPHHGQCDAESPAIPPACLTNSAPNPGDFFLVAGASFAPGDDNSAYCDSSNEGRALWRAPLDYSAGTRTKMPAAAQVAGVMESITTTERGSLLKGL
jgi:hypothetical protein